MNLNSIAALTDNYIWQLSNDTGECLLVDPGDATPVLNALKVSRMRPVAILVTHHHHDHTGGIAALVKHYSGLPVYGPAEAVAKGVNHVVSHNDQIAVLNMIFNVIATPGHTLGHICFYSSPWLFCGDTLFSGGCGRLFEGTSKQMFDSFQQINKLPGETLICCAHEYTLNNLRFAHTLFPSEQTIYQYYLKVKELRAKTQITLPSTLENERQINVFLRTQDDDLFSEINNNITLQSGEPRFAWLRSYKDNF